MRTRTPLAALFAIGLGWSVTTADAAEFEIIGDFFLDGLSADGTAACGTAIDATFETVRWTEAEGVVRLGLSSGALLGRIVSTTEISADGQRIAATIASLDTTVVTQGRWTKGLGWEQTMPPMPPGGAIVDGSAGSGNAISGDGETVVGLFWTENSHARANAWTSAGGHVDLGALFTNMGSRADCVNYDGSVIAGYVQSETATRLPAVWEDGVLTVLYDDPAGNTVSTMNSDGTILGGSTHDVVSGKNPVTLWVKSGGIWQQSVIGVLPGTQGGGRAVPWGIANDGSIVVGKNVIAPGGINASKGFVWTLDQGLMEAEDYIESLGILLPSDLAVLSLTSITPDGRVMGGYGMLGDPYVDGRVVSFLVTRWEATAAPAVRSAVVRLESARPNPFNPATSLPLVLEEASRVELTIYNIAGRHVRTLHDGMLSAGRNVLVWDGRDDSGSVVPSGVYYARARGGWGATESRRMTLLK